MTEIDVTLELNCFYRNNLDEKYIFLLTHYDEKGMPVFYMFNKENGLLEGSTILDLPIESFRMINSTIEVGILNIPK